MSNVAKKKYPKMKSWTAFARIWDDDTFSIDLRHNERTRIFYDYGTIATHRRDLRFKKRELESDLKLLQKQLKKVNEELSKEKK